MLKIRHQDTGAAAANRSQTDLASALLDAAPDQALLLSLDGTVLVVNTAMAKLFHRTPKQMAGEHLYDYFPPEAARKWTKAMRQAVESGSSSCFESSLFAPLELEVRVRAVRREDGNVNSLAIFCRNIAEQKAAEQENTRLGSALEQTADPVILYDEMMRVAYINQAFEAMTGYSLKDVRGMPAAAFYVGPEQQATQTQVLETLARGDAWTGKTCNTCKEGNVICCHKSVAPIRGKGGLILGYVSVWRDVTALEALERQLRQAQKMEALATLAGGIAHDFNNILSPIVLLADIGLCQLEQDDPLHLAFERILKCTLRASKLVQQILGLSRRHETEQPVAVRLAPILEECLTLLRPSMPSTIGIELDIRPVGDVILADPAQMHQMVMNLCTNAAWAMRGSGGTLKLGLDEFVVGRRGDSRFPDVKPGAYVLLSVRDNGQGILPEHMERIFDPLFSTKTDGSGTGLGLAVVHNIVTQMCGSIQVFSAPGQGARFDILLPRSDNAPQEIPTRIPEPPQQRADAGHVLVVDDEPDILDACVLGLRSFGYEVTACLRGEEALELFRAAPGRYDVVLSDTTMPGLAGPDLVRELLKIEPHLPVVLTTGHSDLVTREKAWRLGALEFLAKPFRMDDLASLLSELLAGKQHPHASQKE
jgi:PAS domain S-box-containing protein